MSYNEWLDIDILEDYLDGKLDAKAMHKVERLSLEDPFVAEALEGLSKLPKRSQSLSLLQKQLQERVALKPIEKKRWAITSQRLSIAAAAAVLFIAVSILFWMKGSKQQEMLASNKPKKVEVTVAPQIATNKGEVNPIIENKVSTDKSVIPKTALKNEVAKASVIEQAPIVATNKNPAAISYDTDPIITRQKIGTNEVETVAVSKVRVESRAAVRTLPSKAEGITQSYFSGKVISKVDGLPIVGAIVKVSGADKVIATDKNGEFKIDAETAQNQKLTAGYIGYITTQVDTKPNQPINILLEHDNKSLDEVAIINATSKAGAVPLGGWENYQNYIKTNNKLVKNATDKQEVELDFEIKKDGSVTTINIIKSAGKEKDTEAIRLLKDGPKWIFVPNEKNFGRLKIKF